MSDSYPDHFVEDYIYGGAIKSCWTRVASRRRRGPRSAEGASEAIPHICHRHHRQCRCQNSELTLNYPDKKEEIKEERAEEGGCIGSGD